LKKLLKITFTLIFTTIIVLGFAMPNLLTGSAAGGWYQQFMPNIGSRTIQDIFFLDSLTGWAVTNATNQGNDTIFVLKTTNSGDNWVIDHKKVQTGGGFSGYFKVCFLDQNTGYTTDVRGIYKTSDGGSNWTSLNAPQTAYLDMSVKSTDTIWIVTPEIFAGGVFFTSTGGASWQNQYSAGSQNPEKIYMYNARIGFISDNSGTSSIRKTTNGGLNWNLNVNGEWFNDMKFADSLTGWYSNVNGIYKTTNGGSNWQVQVIPTGPAILQTGISKISVLSKDTVLAAGNAVFYPNSQIRGILLRTINGGDNWLYQIPDTSITIVLYSFVQYIDKNNGWAYNTTRGIHTTTGGDPVWITGIEQTSSEIPKEFKLFQNYPNPFNPSTNIGFRIGGFGLVTIRIFDINGREIITLLNEELSAGEYKTDWNASGYSSGTYFYRLISDNYSETKKMLLVK